MEMREAVNAVAPGIGPTILAERALDHRGRILVARDLDRAAIDHERQGRVVRNRAVVLEPHRDRLDGSTLL